MRRNNSVLWDYFEKVPDKFLVGKCLICQRQLSYRSTTSNLKKHLINIHHINFKTEETTNTNNNNSNNSIDFVYTEFEEDDNPQFSFVGEEVEVHNTLQEESTDIPIITNLKQENVEIPNEPRKRRSAIWDHYLKLPDRDGIAKCLHCNQEYSYKTSRSNIKKHLKLKHMRSCYSLFNEAEVAAYKANFKKKYEDPLSPQSSGEYDDKSTELSNTMKTRRITSADPQVASTKTLIKQKPPVVQQNVNTVRLTLPQNKKPILDKKLLDMIIQDQETFSLVEGEGFRNFVKALNPSYELPTRKLISSKLVPERFNECKKHVMNLVQNVNYLCIAIDSWISLVKDTYITVTAHFMSDYKLNNVMLHCENLNETYTVDTVAKMLNGVVQEYDIEDKITLVVSKNDHNIIGGVEQNGWPSFVCFLQKFNSAIEESIGVIDPIIEKVKRIVVYFKSNVEVTQALLKYQTDVENKTLPLRLILAVSTRWNSVFYMLQRFISLQNAVTSVLEDLPVDLPEISAEMWNTIKQVCMILQPLEETTRAMCGAQYLTASLAIVIVDGLKNVIELMKNKSLNGIAKKLFLSVESCLKTYLLNSEIEDNLLLGVCTFLDPRFKIHAFLDHDSEQDALTDETSQRTRRAYTVKNHVLELLKLKLKEKRQTITNSESDLTHLIVIVEEPQPISIWGKINRTIAAATPSQDDVSTKAKKELEMFLNEEVIWRTSCPLEWWKSHEMIYPNLAEIYAQHSHIVVTSVQCERAFSKTGDILDEKRARLSRKRTPELVFLNSNSHVFN